MHPSSNESMDFFLVHLYIRYIYIYILPSRGGYIIPTTLYKDQNNPLNEDLTFFDEMKLMKPQTGASFFCFGPGKGFRLQRRLNF